MTKYFTDNFILNPNWVTGFCDGESSFQLVIHKTPKMRLGWSVRLVFSIHLHKKDINVLYMLQKFFNVGNISKLGVESVQYRVSAINDLNVIINHFDKYPLITQKFAGYCLFKQAFDMVKNKQHLSKEGLRKIVSIKASLNWGLSSILENSFANIIPCPRPSVSDFQIKDP